MSCNICENFVTFQGLTIYYETYIKLLDLFHQAFSSLNSDREPDVYYHKNFRMPLLKKIRRKTYLCWILFNTWDNNLKPLSIWQQCYAYDPKGPPNKKQVSPLSLGMHQVHSTNGKSTMYWACGSGKTPQIHTCIKPPLKKNPKDRAKRMQLNKQLVKLILNQTVFNIAQHITQHIQ